MKNKMERSTKFSLGLVYFAVAVLAFIFNITFEYAIPTVHDAGVNAEIYAFSIGPQISYAMLALSAIAATEFLKTIGNDTLLLGPCIVSILFSIDCGIVHPILIKHTDMKYNWSFYKILTALAYIEVLLAVILIAIFIIRVVSDKKEKWNIVVMACCAITGTVLASYTALVQYTYGLIYVCVYVFCALLGKTYSKYPFKGKLIG